MQTYQIWTYNDEWLLYRQSVEVMKKKSKDIKDIKFIKKKKQWVESSDNGKKVWCSNRRFHLDSKADNSAENNFVEELIKPFDWPKLA